MNLIISCCQNYLNLALNSLYFTKAVKVHVAKQEVISQKKYKGKRKKLKSVEDIIYIEKKMAKVWKFNLIILCSGRKNSLICNAQLTF